MPVIPVIDGDAPVLIVACATAVALGNDVIMYSAQTPFSIIFVMPGIFPSLTYFNTKSGLAASILINTTLSAIFGCSSAMVMFIEAASDIETIITSSMGSKCFLANI